MNDNNCIVIKDFRFCQQKESLFQKKGKTVVCACVVPTVYQPKQIKMRSVKY